MLEKDASFFRVISTAIALGFYAFDASGVKECGHVYELSILVSTSLVTVHIITLFLMFFFSQVSSPGAGSETYGPKPATSGSITDRTGAMMWRLTPRVSHLIVSETLCLSSTATLCRCSITCWSNCKCRPITGRIKYSLTEVSCIITIASGHYF